MAYSLSSIKESIQATASSLGRLIVIGSTTFGIASYANLGHHKSYWNGTIERVQTVDFNMLSHMLPTKLSQALIEGDGQEVQRTLDSNYGLFGLVVTDCRTAQSDCIQNIQYISNSKLSWREFLTVDTLRASAYDVLRDPPPIYPTGSYTDSRDPVRNPTGLTNIGRIIGRVYYIRGVPPSFLSTYSKWIKAWPASFLSDSGTNRYYSLTTLLFGIGGLSAWMFMELGFSKRRKQIVLNRQAEQLALAQAALVEEAQDLRQELREKLAENAVLIEAQSRSLAELTVTQQKYQSQEAKLQESFRTLKNRLATQDKGYEAEKQRQARLQMAMQTQQQVVEKMKVEIAKLRSQNAGEPQDGQPTAEKIARLTTDQKEKQAQVERYASELEQVWQELDIQTEKREELAKVSALLSEQIEESRHQQAEASLKRVEMEHSLQQIEQERENDKQLIRALEEKLRDEKRQGDELRAVVSSITQSSLNFFEGKVVSELKKTSKVRSSAWSVHTQLDLSRRSGDRASMIADCIVVGNSFIAIIEAKHYPGKIYADGDTRNSAWLCAENQKNSIEIASCWGDNPYKQVTAYMHGAMSFVTQNIPLHRKNICKDISFYGIVVFPDNADLSMLDTDLGPFCRVTTLGSLVDVLHQLARQAQQRPTQKGEKRLSAAEIEACLYGRNLAKPRLKSAA